MRTTDRPDAARPRGLDPHRALLASLFDELFQTERSAEIHPPKEAERLGDTPPAHALRAVAHHAIPVNAELPNLAASRGLPVSKAGSAIGDAFSTTRRMLTDPAWEAERSYRATLLGMRHGLDVVKLIRATADAAGDPDLVAWCTEWLAVREPLVEEVGRQLDWFGSHPEPATRHPAGVKGLLRRIFAGDRRPVLSRGAP